MREVITVATAGDADAVTVFAHLDERGCTYRVVLRFFEGTELIGVESISAEDAPELAEINVAGAWDIDALAALLDEYEVEVTEKPAASAPLALEFAGAESSALSRLSV